MISLNELLQKTEKSNSNNKEIKYKNMMMEIENSCDKILKTSDAPAKYKMTKDIGIFKQFLRERHKKQLEDKFLTLTKLDEEFYRRIMVSEDEKLINLGVVSNVAFRIRGTTKRNGYFPGFITNISQFFTIFSKILEEEKANCIVGFTLTPKSPCYFCPVFNRPYETGLLLEKGTISYDWQEVIDHNICNQILGERDYPNCVNTERMKECYEKNKILYDKMENLKSTNKERAILDYDVPNFVENVVMALWIYQNSTYVLIGEEAREKYREIDSKE